jgi:hypothetical protein
MENSLEFVGLGEVVEVPIPTARRAGEIGEGSVSDLRHGRSEAAETEVEADHAVWEEGPGYILSVYTDA